MSDDRDRLFKQQLIDDVWDELISLKGKELDEYIESLGLAPNDLLRKYEKALDLAHTASQRARFEEARRQVQAKKDFGSAKIVSLDLARKKQIMDAIQKYADRTKHLTIAARNQKIEDEGDLDRVLEAYVSLGLIDDEGNLKE